MNLLLPDHLKLGIVDIDAQHDGLYQALVRIERAIGQPNAWNEVHLSLKELSDYVNVHFAVEEALMRIHAYPSIENHVQLHREFQKNLIDFKCKVLREEIFGHIIGWLRSWLDNHIGKVDRDYAEYLRTASVSFD